MKKGIPFHPLSLLNVFESEIGKNSAHMKGIAHFHERQQLHAITDCINPKPNPPTPHPPPLVPPLEIEMPWRQPWYSAWYFFQCHPRLRFQANRTVTKTWRVNSAVHWLARENHHCLRHWTCTREATDPLDSNQHSQRRIKRNCFEWAHLFLNKQKMTVSLSVEEVQKFLSLIAEERIQRELDGAMQNDFFFRSHGSRGGATINVNNPAHSKRY